MGAPEPTRDTATVLPPDWEQAGDPQTGKTYYYNKRTRASTWTKPTIQLCPNGTVFCHTNKKCFLCQMKARRRLGDPEWLKARRRLSNRRDSPVLLRLLEEIRQAQDT